VKKKQTKGFLLVDIGSASVGASVVHVEKGEVVLGKVKRQAVGAGSQETRDSLEKQALTALDTLMKEYAGSYSEVRIVVAAPWHQAHIRTIKSKGEKPASVSVRSIEKLLETYKNEKAPAEGNVDIEAVALQVRVNNYPTALFEPVTGTNVAVNLYESEMPKRLRGAFVEKVEAHIDTGQLAFYSFPLVSSTALRAITSESSFIFIDVGGEVTELGIMYGDAVQYLASVPVGYWTIMRTMEGKSIGDTRSRLALWIKGELNPQETASLQEVFSKAFAPWIQEIEETLKEASALVPIPRTAFLMSDTEPALWIQKGLQEQGTMNLAPTIISPSSVQRFVNVGEGGVFDVFLALEALFFHIGLREIIGEPKPSKVL